ncbi:zinc finger protein 76-like [Neocloeon triangulifer]|uniref:zinc finger protein 76-like n=1 Tax=Neocloeon triangulifer TaxID=2078957 RepID=UPI00286ECDF9|nr:zinc finger protein 76-like [Neocloeon triangulifer]
MAFATPILVSTQNGSATVILRESTEQDGTKRCDCVVYEIDTSSINLKTDEIFPAENEFVNELNTEESTSHLNVGDVSTCVPKSKSYPCTFEGCDKKYSSKGHLLVHIRSHTGERPFKCASEGCGKSFANSYSYKTHLRTHSNERPYQCENCKKAFRTTSDLNKHSRLHRGEKPYKCSIEGCEKCFTTSGCLKIHLRTHTGERPFVCTYDNCGKSFIAIPNYKNHLRTHSGEKPLVCPLKDCGRTFSEYSTLNKHISVHNPAKPFTCEMCQKGFRRIQSLVMHKKSIHGLELTVAGTSNESEEVVLDRQMDDDLALSEKVNEEPEPHIILVPPDTNTA